MSGQPVNKPSDVKKFRAEYLRTIAQQEANNEKNLKANALFKQTGVPQQPTDTRTVEEKLKDIEALKPEIRSQLLELMDGANAEKVVQNVSSQQLMYLAQAMPVILSVLKPKYTRGIVADAFIAELNRLIVADAKSNDFVKPTDEDINRVNATAIPTVQATVSTGDYIPIGTVQSLNKTDLEAYIRIIKPKASGELKTASQGKKNKQQMLDFLTKYDVDIKSLFGKPIESFATTPVRKASPLKKRKVGDTKMTPIAGVSENEMGMAMTGFGMKKERKVRGCGLVRKHKNDVLKEEVDWTVGVPVPIKYVPLGRYIIHKRQLDKDIVSIKTKSGKQIAGLNAQKVGGNLAKVLRKIIGGGNPTFEEVYELTEDEKNYLHKVASKAEIIDRLSIPAPNKQQDDKDINQFEIMKGQILSGNDSTEMIKNFKLLILKLVKKELIPKKQANDMLFELISLGY